MVRKWIFTLIVLHLTAAISFADDVQPDTSSTSDVPSSTTQTSTSKQSGQMSLKERKGQQELEAIRQRPEDYRVLVLGVQIFLGRFGYGVGPYTGTMDEATQKALQRYQHHVGLPSTGELDYPTLAHLTDDNKILDQPLPYLPQYAFQADQWEKAIQVQGTWARDTGPTSDAIQTSRLYCFRKQKQCIESTAVLLVEQASMLNILTHVYAIKEWDDEQLVSEPYDGEPCTISILRIHRRNNTVTRFSAYKNGEGLCAKVKTEDVQYRLINGQDVFLSLQKRKAQETQAILRVEEEKQ
ncbi:MAG: peptidoglycan-binding protein [Nitrospirales bacterium]|nr:peptidoglycan-binding protein [Nitrospirales bacterium]